MIIKPSCDEHVWVIDPYQRQLYQCAICGRFSRPFRPSHIGCAVHVVTWRYWNTFSYPKFALQAVQRAYAKGYQFAFRYFD